ncbi:MAG: DUF1501 domain-containing protein [Planctomycetes bacterium]|nr:DUF1501 domain-containing protein [Planctomycetota bacterium]
MRSTQSFSHPLITRRTALQAGGISLLGLGMGHLSALRAETTSTRQKATGAVIYIFLSGGLAQHDSFDPKPNAAESIRGEFKPIATKTPGIQICEHLPMLAARSDRWALVRSLTHPSNGHSEGHHIMMTGRSDIPPGFNGSVPKDTDWPSLAAITGGVTQPRNNLPPAVVLPERLVHNTGRVLPGQFAGRMGRQRDPWFLEASKFEPKAYGAYPEYEFDHQQREYKPVRKEFEIPDLSLPQGINDERLANRLDILKHIDAQRGSLDQGAGAGGIDRHRAAAVSMLTDARVRKAFDLKHAPAKDLERYGNNSFGWSLMMAARLVEAGVNMVQVNLGNNESWDTHGNSFGHLKNKLLPPTDRSVSALIDDLSDRGLLDKTLIVMAGEFGRTPRVFGLTKFYKEPGRDHWGAVQSVFFAGGGVKGGTVIGSSDKTGGYPHTEPQTPENMAATIYQSLGLPQTTAWLDAENRPHHIYNGEPILGLTKQKS